MVFPPDGRLFASVCRCEYIAWEVNSGPRLYFIANVDENKTAPIVSPESQVLAWLTGHRAVSFWRTDSGVQLGTLKTISTPSIVAFSPDGRHFAILTTPSFTTGSRSTGIETVISIKDMADFFCWELYTSSELKIWDVHKLLDFISCQNCAQVVDCIITSSEGKLLAIALCDGSVQALVKENNAFCPLLRTSFDQPISLIFSPNSKELTTLS
jgi:hypothetical protein